MLRLCGEEMVAPFLLSGKKRRQKKAGGMVLFIPWRRGASAAPNLPVLLRSACWRSRPPSSDAAANFAKRKSAAARSTARAGFGAALGPASRARGSA